MGELVLEIPTEIVDALRYPPSEAKRELQKELAVALYERQVLSFGKARQLAGITRWEFEEILGQRQILRDYAEDDLKDDLRYGDSGE